MDEIENWVYYASSDQIIRDLLERPHKVPQMIPKISGKSRTNYKQQLKIPFKILLVILLPTRYSTQLTPMRCAEIFLFDRNPHKH